MAVLHVVTCLANPLAGVNRVANAKRAILSWLENQDVCVTVVECIYPWQPRTYLHDLWMGSRYHHITVESNSWCWNQRNLFNIGIESLPSNAEFVATLDADIMFVNDPA